VEELNEKHVAVSNRGLESGVAGTARYSRKGTSGRWWLAVPPTS